MNRYGEDKTFEQEWEDSLSALGIAMMAVLAFLTISVLTVVAILIWVIH